MSLDPTSGKPKKIKPASYLEFDFEGDPAPEVSEKKIEETPSPSSEVPSEKEKPEPDVRPFGKPFSSHFENKIKPDFTSENITDSKSENIEASSKPAKGGTALGSFRAQSTVLPSKPISASVFQAVAAPNTTPPSEDPMSSSMPSMSDFRRNTERQVKEQKATGNILSGIAYALLAAVFIVAALAGFGGLVMWRQIQSQATTVAQLSDSTNSSFAAVRAELAESQKALEEKDRRQQDQINRLTGAFDQQRAAFAAEQKKKDREIQTLQATVKRLEGRAGVTR